MLCYNSRFPRVARKAASQPHDERENATKKRKENHRNDGSGYRLFYSNVVTFLLFSHKQQHDTEQWYHIRISDSYGTL
jgi:hypothetical protein